MPLSVPLASVGTPLASRRVTVATSGATPLPSATATEANGCRPAVSVPLSALVPAVTVTGATSCTSVPPVASRLRCTSVPSASATPTCATVAPPFEMVSSPPCTRVVSPAP